ncbi:MAG: hypothetical protein KDK97_23180, partial [Verrucomicrobiales bacterium]|nr:hypothetical protein [Verrucomicrobiales bacterium]
MKPFLLAFSILASPLLAQDSSPPLTTEERLSRIEQQIAVLLEEVRALRREQNGGQPTPGPGGSVAVEERLVPGCSVKTFVRTGGADPASPPPSKVTPSDEREDTGKLFDAFTHRAAAGYANEAVTVLWDGYVRITEKDVYEFIFTGYQ